MSDYMIKTEQLLKKLVKEIIFESISRDNINLVVNSLTICLEQYFPFLILKFILYGGDVITVSIELSFILFKVTRQDSLYMWLSFINVTPNSIFRLDCYQRVLLF